MISVGLADRVDSWITRYRLTGKDLISHPHLDGLLRLLDILGKFHFDKSDSKPTDFSVGLLGQLACLALWSTTHITNNYFQPVCSDEIKVVRSF